MKLLHFSLLAPGSPQTGMRDALQAIAKDYIEFDWHSFYRNGNIPGLQREFLNVATRFRPTHCFLQVQTAGILPGELLAQIPGTKIQWCGDCRSATPQWAWDIAPHVAMNFFSNKRDVENLHAKGYNARYLNIGFSEKVFTPEGEKRPGTAEIIFLGNNYGPSHFPLGAQRQEMVAMLRQRYGPRFAVHGNGWGPHDIWLDEPTEAAAYRNCKIAIGQNHYDDVPGFSSDRIFRAMGCGAFCIHNHFPGIEESYNIGEHLITWKNFNELTQQIDHYLAHEQTRNQIAAAGCAHTHQHHTWARRIQALQWSKM
jgi:hypothetical protein